MHLVYKHMDTCHSVSVEDKDSLQDSVLSLLPHGSRDLSQVGSLGGKCLFCLTISFALFFCLLACLLALKTSYIGAGEMAQQLGHWLLFRGP